MSEQDNSEADKLMIVESGRRRGTGPPVSSSEPLMFQRQIVGRHVIYNSSDGSKLRSMAEARRYFKQKGHVFIESQFDFTPPVAESKKKASSAKAASPSTSSPSKNVRGRPKSAVTPKPSPSKSTRRKDLADDVKAIKDSLKDDENEGSTAEIQPPVQNSNKRPRGRAKRNTVERQPEQIDEQAAPSVTVESASGESKMPQEEQESGIDGNKGRPTRQRKPNQRYTDLISETESSRKRTRKSSTTDADQVKNPSPSTMPKLAKIYQPAPTVSQSLAAMRAAKSDTQWPPMPRGGLPVVRASPSNRRGKAASKRGEMIRQSPAMRHQAGVKVSTMPFGGESFDDQDINLSAVPAGEFEAPPEFAEIHDQVTSAKEEQLPPVLPAGPSSVSMSSLLYTPQAATSSNIVAPVLQPMMLSSAVSVKRYETEPTPLSSNVSVKRYEAEPAPAPAPAPAPTQALERLESPDPYLTPEERKIIRPVTRGRKPNSGLTALGTSWQRMVRSLEDADRNGGDRYTDTARQRRSGETSAKRSDYGAQGIRVQGSSRGSPLYSDWSSGAGQGSARGLAKLQRGEPKRITIGRYGATSFAASMAALRDPPPELEPYGGPTVERAKPTKPGKSTQRGGRPHEPTDASLFVHLPPEVVSDHCYGRQPEAPVPPAAPADGQPKPSASVAAKSGNGQSYGSPPPALIRVEQPYQRRSLQNERSPSQRQQFRTPSPPPYQSQRYRTTSSNYNSYQNMDVGTFSGDLGAGGAGVGSTMGGQQMDMLGDKLPANILEEDDGEATGELASSVIIN